MYGHYGLLVIAVIALGLGVFMVAKPDAMWRFTQWRNRAGGVASGERGPAWERWNRITACIVVLAGVGAGFGFWQFEKIVAKEEARRERAENLPEPSFDLHPGGPGEDR